MANIRIRHEIIELIDFTLKNNEVIEPLCDIFEKNNKIYIDLEIVGLDESNFKIEINNNIMTVTGVKKKHSVENANYLRAERIFGVFKKTVEIPNKASNIENVIYKKGILRIIMNKGWKSLWMT